MLDRDDKESVSVSKGRGRVRLGRAVPLIAKVVGGFLPPT